MQTLVPFCPLEDQKANTKVKAKNSLKQCGARIGRRFLLLICDTIKTMKRLFSATLFVLLILSGYIFRDNFVRVYQRLMGVPETTRTVTAKDAIQEIEKKISLPSPLRAVHDAPQSFLSEKGVIAWTNSARRNNGGLSGLTNNDLLRAAATAKVDDMFQRQYFEHVSPSGAGPADLAKDAGYEYIAIGENLALGNFENDEVLVTAWMNSPGHRANILNATYTEIGVAVKHGVFEGKAVWLAVQEFGRPLSVCPAPDKTLEAQIVSASAELDVLGARIAMLREELDRMRRRDPEYNEKIDAYNTLVGQYNELAAMIKEIVAAYNATVRTFNECIQ